MLPRHMELRHSTARSLHLRQSYIGISKYIHTQLCHGQPVAARRLPHCRTQRHLTTSPLKGDQKRKPAVFDFTALQDYKSSRLTTSLHDQAAGRVTSPGESSSGWGRLRQLDPDTVPPTSDPIAGEEHLIELYGYITSHRPLKNFDFIQLVDPRLECAVQVLVPKRGTNSVDLADPGEDGSSAELPLQTQGYRPHTPVRVLGSIARRSAPQSKRRQTQQQDPLESRGGSTAHNTVKTLDPHVGRVDLLSGIEVHARDIKFYNNYTSNIVADCNTVIPPELRHLQFRTDPGLRSRIRLRSRLSGKIREHMLSNAFDEIETPLLFKSTPEGAREFVVPTRRRGMAYALPQSPQQYKQVLMASGISRYFQFAKCFRDEDLRADRQPEFTQLDLEMSFAGSVDVMKTAEDLLMNAVWPNVPGIAPLPISASAPSTETEESDPEYPGLSFQRLTYDVAMRRYGSDKPDTRLQSEIHRVDGWLPANVKGMVTTLDDPVVEMIKIDMQNCEPAESQKFFKKFLEGSPAARYATDEARIPGVAVYDPLKPLHGLATFGHEAAARVEEEFNPEPGDLLILWAREDKAFTGGSTVLGDLRRDIYHSAISQGLISAPTGFAAMWVTDFPLFSPTTDSEPGQGGSAGICSTHHPFTAPKLDRYFTPSAFKDNPLSIIGDHYDLVINGVEVGGGSCRIHRGDMQLCILRDVLKLKHERINDFSHLFEALNAGCPPHAGFALGFDRLMAMLTDSASVKDVIAFPKTAEGEDKFVHSPSQLTREQLATYHLAIVEKVQKLATVQISKRA